MTNPIEDTMSMALEASEKFQEDTMSLNQFIHSNTNYECFYPHIKKAFEDIQKNLKRTTVINGPLGSGKASLYNNLFLYKIYLYSNLQNPHNYFGHAESAKQAFGIICSNKGKKLCKESLLHTLESYPDIFEKWTDVKCITNRRKLYFEFFPEPEVIVRFHRLRMSLCEKDNLDQLDLPAKIELKQDSIDVLQIWEPEDLLGKSFISTLCVELNNLTAEKTEEDLYSLVLHTWKRVDARTYPDILMVSGAIIEKAPNDVLLSKLDHFLYNNFTVNHSGLPNSDVTVVTFPPVWELFPNRYGTTENTYAFLNLETEELEVTPTSSISGKVPIPVKCIDICQNNVKEFIRNFIGIPTSTVYSYKTERLRNWIQDFKNMKGYFEMKDGRIYLGVEGIDIKYSLEELCKDC